jgi:hypothetical protein
MLLEFKNQIDEKLLSSFINEDKNTYNQIIKKLKENKDLGNLYLIVKNFDNPPIIKENQIRDFIKIQNTSLSKSLIKEIKEKKNNDQYWDAVTYVLSNKQSFKNFDEYEEKIEIVENVLKNKIIEKIKDTEIQKLVENVDVEKVYAINETVKVINEKIEEASKDDKISLLEAKVKLLEMLNKDLTLTDIASIIELKNEL